MKKAFFLALCTALCVIVQSCEDPADVASTPDFSVSTPTLDFGTIPANTSRKMTVQITNNSGSPMNPAASISGTNAQAFTTSTSTTIANGATDNITVEFRPTVAGAYAGKLTIGQNHLTVVQLLGTAQ